MMSDDHTSQAWGIYGGVLEKYAINKNIKYYDNIVNVDRVLSDKLRKSGTLEEEQVNNMKIILTSFRHCLRSMI